MRRARPVGWLIALLLVVPGCHRDKDKSESPVSNDFNADGRPDVAVAAPLENAGGTDRGRVHVYTSLGGSSIVLTGAEDGARFGFSVASIGDFNGDGRADLAVGAPLDDADGDSADSTDNRGRVFVYLGGASFPAGTITLNGTDPGGQFGHSVAAAGDVDGNGFDDLLVGAPFEDGGGTERGRAFLFLGGTSPSTTPAVTFTGSEDSGRFGFSVAGAGFLNSDDFPDWAIGAPGDDNDGDTADAGLDRGRVFVYRGATFPDNSVDVTLNGSEDFAEFGTCVAGIGDVNGDGTDDLLAGAPFEDGDGNNATNTAPFRGRAYLFFGTALNVAAINTFGASRIFTGTEADGNFGAWVAGLGDINGTGSAADFFIGAPLDDGDGNPTDEGDNRGRGFIYFGGGVLDTAADVTLTGGEPGARLGTWAGAPGDIDGDGDPDLLVGAPGDDVDGNGLEDNLNRGRALFFRGGGALNPTSDDSLEGSLEDGAEAGTSGA